MDTGEGSKWNKHDCKFAGVLDIIYLHLRMPIMSATKIDNPSYKLEYHPPGQGTARKAE